MILLPGFVFFALAAVADINVNVSWEKVPGQPPRESSKDQTRNISAGGICLIVYEKLRQGDVLKLDIELPNKQVITSRGRVAWVKEFQMGRTDEKKYDAGIEFMDINDQQRSDIRQFVFKVLQDQENKS